MKFLNITIEAGLLKNKHYENIVKKWFDFKIVKVEI